MYLDTVVNTGSSTCSGCSSNDILRGGGSNSIVRGSSLTGGCGSVKSGNSVRGVGGTSDISATVFNEKTVLSSA
jgi:hypothetical protein